MDQGKANDLMNALSLFSKYHGNEVIAFDDIEGLVAPCRIRWTQTEYGSQGLGAVGYGKSLAVVRGYSRRTLLAKFAREHPGGRMEIDAAETEKLLTPWWELASALCFVMLGEDPGGVRPSQPAAQLRVEALKKAFWTEIKRLNH